MTKSKSCYEHGIVLADFNGNIIVSSEKMNPIVAKSKFYQKFKYQWFVDKLWDSSTPIHPSHLDFTVNDVDETLKLNLNKRKKYYFYHSFYTYVCK